MAINDDPRRIVSADPFNCESALEQVTGWITPTPLHFVRSSHPAPSIDAATWRLRVEGDSVRSSLELSLDDLLALPSRSQVCWMECAGNNRSFFESVQGRPVDAAQLPWNTAAVGNAEWTGVSLSEILNQAGVESTAVDVHIEGLDEGKRGRPIPLDVALKPTTILAYSMNGAPIPPDHGYPVRAIVPGWIGMNHVKWVGRIEVASYEVKVPTNTSTYVFEGPDFPDKPPLTIQPLKSVVALPWDAQLPARPQMIRGFAWTPHGRIAAVEYSVDGGSTWSQASLLEPNIPLAWVRWEFHWNPEPGQHTIMTRANDEQGNRQPDSATWNRLGYLYNAVVAHQVSVS
jgi:sulfane dehydrogenase subunit SoxC